jgi:hypothetical protein
LTGAAEGDGSHPRRIANRPPGIIDRAQFSVLVTVVVLTAVVPTAIAQRFFSPDHPSAHLHRATPGR